MPELPEVETIRRFLDELALNVPIAAVQVLDAQPLAHIGHLVDGFPVVTPTAAHAPPTRCSP